jgi:hypothetical protein
LLSSPAALQQRRARDQGLRYAQTCHIEGVTTKKGLREYLVLLSFCETCKYRGIDFLNFLHSGERDTDAFAENPAEVQTPEKPENLEIVMHE